MASYLIPLRPVPSQIVMATVEDVNYVIKLREIGGRQYLSISSKDVVFAETVLLVSGTEILNLKYKNFPGEIFVKDLYGENQAPKFSGWGTRWQLIFKSAESE